MKRKTYQSIVASIHASHNTASPMNDPLLKKRNIWDEKESRSSCFKIFRIPFFSTTYLPRCPWNDRDSNSIVGNFDQESKCDDGCEKERKRAKVKKIEDSSISSSSVFSSFGGLCRSRQNRNNCPEAMGCFPHRRTWRPLWQRGSHYVAQTCKWPSWARQRENKKRGCVSSKSRTFPHITSSRFRLPSAATAKIPPLLC